MFTFRFGYKTFNFQHNRLEAMEPELQINVNYQSNVADRSHSITIFLLLNLLFSLVFQISYFPPNCWLKEAKTSSKC